MVFQDSIQQYRDIASGKQQRYQEHLAAAAKPKKAMSGLVASAQSFAANQDRLQKQEHDYSSK